MPTYRFFKLSIDGHIFGPPDIRACLDDAEAVETAKQTIDGYDVEIWDLNRRVAHIKSPEKD